MDEMHFEWLEKDAFAKAVARDNILFSLSILRKTRQIITNMIDLMDIFTKMGLMFLAMLVILTFMGSIASEKLFIGIFSVIMFGIVVCLLIKLKYCRKQQSLDEHIDDLEIKYAVQSLNDQNDQKEV